MSALNRYPSGSLLKKPTSRWMAHCFYIAGVLTAMAAAAVLITFESA